MLRIFSALCALSLGAAFGFASDASADPARGEGVTVTVNTLGAAARYPVLTRGQVVIINAQRLVVTQEPAPVGMVAEAPPEPKALDDEASRPEAPSASAVWVDAHWAYGPTGFTWIAGRYVAPRRGYVFVPPRWAELEEQYLYFSGFYVPRGVYVRSHFNRYYYSGRPKNGTASGSGPYWPVGAPTTANRRVTSANDPYWPIGARR